MNNLLSRNQPKIFPNSDSPSTLASSFLKYFDDKITKLCSSIRSHSMPTLNEPEITPEITPPIFSDFDPCTKTEIRKLILSSSNATCSLDVLPTKFLKSCIDALASPITRLVNLALLERAVPDNFKHAIVNPLLKKSSQSKNELSSYHSISSINLSSENS